MAARKESAFRFSMDKQRFNGMETDVAPTKAKL